MGFLEVQGREEIVFILIYMIIKAIYIFWEGKRWAECNLSARYGKDILPSGSKIAASDAPAEAILLLRVKPPEMSSLKRAP